MMDSSQQISQGTTSNSGVVLMAFGKPQYYGAAYNLAYSIKRFNKSIKIACLVESMEDVGKYCGDLHEVVDVIRPILSDNLYTNRKLDPAKAKVNLYYYLPFDHNIYLDVDAVALKDIKPMIDVLISSGKPYASHCVGYHTIDKGRSIDSMQWAWADDIWSHYKFDDKTVLPAINSSIQYIKKCNQSLNLYKKAQDYYHHNPIPLHKLRMKWGGGQPDELYMNCALAKLGMDPAIGEIGSNGYAEKGFIHFTDRRGLSYAQVTEMYYLQSYYGGQGFTPSFYIEWLDRLLKSWMKQDGKVHKYFINRIISNKHADPKR
jgi:hypothetical protein